MWKRTCLLYTSCFGDGAIPAAVPEEYAGHITQMRACFAVLDGAVVPAPEGVRRIDVLTAADMYRAATELFPSTDGAGMCAAVADYTPAEVADRKLKKGDGDLTIRLCFQPTPKRL